MDKNFGEFSREAHAVKLDAGQSRNIIQLRESWPGKNKPGAGKRAPVKRKAAGGG